METKRPQKAGMPKERQNSQDQAKVFNPRFIFVLINENIKTNMIFVFNSLHSMRAIIIKLVELFEIPFFSCSGGFLLTHDALQQYSRPVTVLNFNYANYAGDYRKYALLIFF